MTTVTPATPAQQQPQPSASAATPATETETAAAETSSPVGNALIDSDFETFLLMLTTQLQNQDPLNPMESQEFAVQLATFSGVEQQVRSNDLLESIQSQLNQMSMTQLAGWVGMEARVNAPAWFDGGPITLMPEPAPAADRAELVVYNEANTEVGRYPVTPSSDPIAWYGMQQTGEPYPQGLYSFKLESYIGSELLSAKEVEVYTEIVEARNEDGATMLVLEGGTSISSDEIMALRRPEVQSAA